MSIDDGTHFTLFSDMVQPTFTETYDYLRRIAPEFTARIAQAATQTHNEAEFERELNNAIAGELDIGLFFTSNP
jgi:hypothetical protein